jgi:hypothetical protein
MRPLPHQRRWLAACRLLLAAGTLATLLGCASRSQEIAPEATSPAQFASWGCDRIDTEIDLVQRRAADVAYAVDVRANNNLFAMGLGLAVFWPALLAMRPDGHEATELARLKGRYEALREALRAKACPDLGPNLPPSRAAELAVAPGEVLVYEERMGSTKAAATERRMRLNQLLRDELEWAPARNGGEPLAWRSDYAGNVVQAPAGQLRWPRLLRHELKLGDVIAGELQVSEDAGNRARVRGQVVAVGPQTVGNRRFDVLVVELFGDAQRGETSTRLDGVLVVDRASGVLLRLDLRSAQPGFVVQRRLVRVEPATS